MRQKTDSIDQQLAACYEKHIDQPNNGAHSQMMGALFEQKLDYFSALLWYQHAFEAGGCTDSALKAKIDDLKSRGASDSN